jgi:hypothetical protein
MKELALSIILLPVGLYFYIILIETIKQIKNENNYKETETER